MYTPQVSEFTVKLTSDARGRTEGNNSASYEVEFDKEKILDENHDWYVAAKELYLPTHRHSSTHITENSLFSINKSKQI